MIVPAWICFEPNNSSIIRFCIFMVHDSETKVVIEVIFIVPPLITEIAYYYIIKNFQMFTPSLSNLLYIQHESHFHNYEFDFHLSAA